SAGVAAAAGDWPAEEQMFPCALSTSCREPMCSGLRSFLGCKGLGRRADVTFRVEGCPKGLDDTDGEVYGARGVLVGEVGDTYCRSSKDSYSWPSRGSYCRPSGGGRGSYCLLSRERG